MYNTASLKAGIEKCKENIKIFEQAIENERNTIKDYYAKIEILEDQERKAREAEQKIHIEIDNDG